MNKKYKEFIIKKIYSSEPYLRRDFLEANIMKEFGITAQTAKLHIRKFINECCYGKEQVAHHYKISKYRELFSKEDISDKLLEVLPKLGRTRYG